MTNNYINHIVFVIDESGSMQPLRDSVAAVFNNQIKHLAQRSTEMDQETRVSVFTFNNAVKCAVYDKDVLRLPNINDFYCPNGQTALIDATVRSITDLQQTPEKYGDHAFLAYVVTDGQENASIGNTGSLSGLMARLPDNWTVAVLVPDQMGVHYAKSIGFPADNISVWETSSRGIEEAGRKMRAATEQFMTGRTQGIRGTKKLFMDTSSLTKVAVKENLDRLPKSKYVIVDVKRDATIKDFVENKVGTYVKGNAFYELTKTEKVQGYKQICIHDRKNGDVYGGDEARAMLGLPNTEIKVAPDKSTKFDIFVQSTSVNRKLIGGTKVLVLK